MQDKAATFITACHNAGITDVVIICTDRSDSDQQAAFDSHHSNCKPGQSAHNAKKQLEDGTWIPVSEAFDIGIIRAGKYVGDGSDPDYQRAGAIGKGLGLVWAGDWVSFKETAHFQNSTWVKP